MSTLVSASALELAGTYIMSYYRNSFYQYATLNIEADGNNVTINNLFGCNKPITGTYDETTKQLSIPAGQLINETSTVKRYLYSYTIDESSNRITDYESNIVFSVAEGSSYNTFSTEQNLVALNEESGTGNRYTTVRYRNYQNATIQGDIISNQSPYDVTGTDNYPVYVDMIAEGKYLIRNFDQRARLYIYTHRDGTFSTEYEDYPAIYSSTLSNYYYPGSFVIGNNNKYTIISDKNIYGEISNKQTLTFNSVWGYICDNRENTKAEEAYRNLYYYSSDLHKNTTITLNAGKFNLPHTTHEAASDELVLTTKANFDAYNEEGWMWNGDTNDDASVSEITNKKTTIEPGTDATIKSTVYAGLNIKNHGNLKKNVYMRVKGLNGLKFYVTSNGSDTRTAIITLTPTEGTPVTKELPSTGSGAYDTVDGLNHDTTYDIEFCTTEKDMTLYAVQFLASATGIDEVSNNTSENIASPAIYDLQGRRIENITTPGLYITNGKKILFK